MSKKSSKKKGKNYFEDVTIGEFANSKFSSNRAKKSSCSTTIKTEVEEPPISWEWEDIADDDIDLVEEENEDGTTSIVVAKNSPKREKRNLYNIDHGSSEGIQYPSIVWFLISEYIKPEDIGRFAGICRDCLHATWNAKFWYDLYNRYCRKSTSLPHYLRPQYVARRYGLRAKVIRSLFYTYIPFCHRPTMVKYSTPEDLIKRRCIGMWFHPQMFKQHWTFYFKMKHIYEVHGRCRHDSGKSRDWLTIMDDISWNSEEDCKVLVVHCCNFSSAPPVMGMVLQTLQTSLSPNMREQRLTLGFSTSSIHQTYAVPESTVTLTGVMRTQVLDWWLPMYPYSHDSVPVFPSSLDHRLVSELTI